MATRRMIFVDPATSTRAKRIPEERWVLHRAVIEQLWLVEDRPMQEVIRMMSREYDFLASEPQYRMKFREWKLSKNMRSATRKAPGSMRRSNSVSSLHPTSLQALCNDLDLNDDLDSVTSASAPSCSQRYHESPFSRLRHGVPSAEMSYTGSLTEFDATVDILMLPAIEDEAWTQFERDMDGYEHMEVTEPDHAASDVACTVSASTTQGGADLASDFAMEFPNAGSDPAHPDALPPPMSTKTEQDATTHCVNAMSSSKAFGEDMYEGNPLTQVVSGSVIQSGLGTFDPSALRRQTPTVASKAFEYMDFDELMLHLIEPPAQDSGEVMTNGYSSNEASGACPGGTTNIDDF